MSSGDENLRTGLCRGCRKVSELKKYCDFIQTSILLRETRRLKVFLGRLVGFSPSGFTVVLYLSL